MTRLLHALDVARALWWFSWHWEVGPVRFWDNYRCIQRYYGIGFCALAEDYWREWRQ